MTPPVLPAFACLAMVLLCFVVGLRFVVREVGRDAQQASPSAGGRRVAVALATSRVPGWLVVSAWVGFAVDLAAKSTA